MKNILCFILLCAGLLPVFSRDYTEFVNPLVGTQSTFELSAGNTYPAIARPWGMNFGLHRQERWATVGNIRIQPTVFVALSRLISPAHG